MRAQPDKPYSHDHKITTRLSDDGDLVIECSCGYQKVCARTRQEAS